MSLDYSISTRYHLKWIVRNNLKARCTILLLMLILYIWDLCLNSIWLNCLVSLFCRIKTTSLRLKWIIRIKTRSMLCKRPFESVKINHESYTYWATFYIPQIGWCLRTAYQQFRMRTWLSFQLSNEYYDLYRLLDIYSFALIHLSIKWWLVHAAYVFCLCSSWNWINR